MRFLAWAKLNSSGKLDGPELVNLLALLRFLRPGENFEHLKQTLGLHLPPLDFTEELLEKILVYTALGHNSWSSGSIAIPTLVWVSLPCLGDPIFFNLARVSVCLLPLPWCYSNLGLGALPRRPNGHNPAETRHLPWFFRQLSLAWWANLGFGVWW